MAEKTRIAIIGLGFGVNHLQIAATLPEAELVAASDLIPERGKVAESVGARFYQDFRQMLDKERLDGVVAVVSNDQHEPVAVECLQRGISVLLEKPIAPTLEAADRIIAAADRSGTPLLIGHHRRFSAFVVRAREMVQGGALGDLTAIAVLWTILKPKEYYQATWRTKKATGGGPLLINTIHDVDDIRYICGREVTRVFAETSNRTRGFEVEDTIAISLRMQGDVVATITTSDCVPSIWAYESTTSPWENPYFFYSPEDCYYFFGTKGSLTLPQMRHVWYPDAEKAGWQWPLQVDRLGVTPVHPLREEIRHFCRVARREEEPRTTGRDARRTLEVVLAIMKSGETGLPVQIGG